MDNELDYKSKVYKFKRSPTPLVFWIETFELRSCLHYDLCAGGPFNLTFRNSGGVVDNTLGSYQSRDREIDPPLHRSFG